MSVVKGIPVQTFYDEMKEKLRLDLVAGQKGLVNQIRVAELNRPGLSMAGYFDYFARKRIQVFGKVELKYISTLSAEDRRLRFRQLMQQKIPTCIVARKLVPPKELLEEAERAKVPVFRSNKITMHLVNLITLYLEDKFAPATTMSGNLVEVFGMGMLILGQSGAGKSECALSLIKRGHRLVADDAVQLKLEDDRQIVGTSNSVTRYHMEIRGLGIINIQKIFGAGCVRHYKQVDCVVTLEDWKQGKEYERVGLEDATLDILGLKLPNITIPVRPGRDIALLVETASLNQRLKYMGIHSAQEFNRSLIERLEGK